MRLFPQLCAAALLCAGAVACAHATSETYTLDPNHTNIIVTWDHLGYAHPSAMFNHIHGSVVYDPAHPAKSSVEASIPISSVHTASSDLDEHLQAADFFDAAKYPNATFKSTKVTPGSAPNTLQVAGTLTAHGKTVPVTLQVVINKVGARRGRPHIAFNASTTLKRSDLGVALFAPAVSDEVKLTLTTGAYAKRADSKPKPKSAD